MIFNANKNQKVRFRFGNRYIGIVDSYRYLGLTFSKNGKFFKAKKAVYEQAQKAIFSLMQTSRNQNLPVDVTLDLYKTMVVPVLLYGCEIWGYENVTVLEKLQFLGNYS